MLEFETGQGSGNRRSIGKVCDGLHIHKPMTLDGSKALKKSPFGVKKKKVKRYSE